MKWPSLSQGHGKNGTMRYMFKAGEAAEPKNNRGKDAVGESSKD